MFAAETGGMEWGWVVAMGGAIAAVCTAAGTAAGAVIKTWFDKKREMRQDEVAVLHQDIKDLRADRDAMRREVGVLKDEHTQCLIVQERLMGRVRALEKQLGIQTEEVDHGTHPAR